jgi:Tfp pilus assembly protein PilF
VLAVIAAGAIIVAQAIPLLADVELRRSQADIRAGRTEAARSHAIGATRIEPWAATPYLQLALVNEGAGDLPAARRAIGEAIRRDRRDWRLWFVAARIEARLGEVLAADRSRERAKALNPRSQLFSPNR